MKKYGLFSLCVVMIVFNLLLLLNLKRKESYSTDLTRKYQSKCSDEKKLISLIEICAKFQGKQLVIYDDSLRNKLLESSDFIPLLLVRQNVCSVCFDSMLLELEKMRSDSLALIKKLIVIQWSDDDNIKRNGIASVFKAKNNTAYFINREKLNILQESSFPDMLFILVDKKLDILSSYEFSTNYPSLFLQELKFISSNYYIH